MSGDLRSLTVRVKSDFYQKMKEFSIENDCTMTDVVEYSVRKVLFERKKPKKTIKQKKLEEIFGN